MPTFRQDLKLGTKVPTIKTDDITDLAVTTGKLRDKSVTAAKLADGAVSVDKLEESLRKSIGSSVDVSVLFAQINELKSELASTKSGLQTSIIELRAYHDASLADFREDNDKAFASIRRNMESNDQAIWAQLNVVLDEVFPIRLTLSVVYDTGKRVKNVSYSVRCMNQPFTPDTLSITRLVNDSTEPVSLLAKPSSDGSFTDNLQGCRETFTITAAAEYHSEKSISFTRYMYYAGALSGTFTSADFSRLRMDFFQGIHDISCTVTTPDDPIYGGQYIYIILPVYVQIDRVTSAGFDVPLYDVVTPMPSNFGMFVVYRTLNRLTAATWNLDIQLSEHTTKE